VGSASCTVVAKPPLSAILTIPDGFYKPRSIIPISVAAKRGAVFAGGVSTQYFLVRPNRQKNKITLPSTAQGTTIWYYRPPVSGVYTVHAVSTQGTETATSNTGTFTVH